MQIYVNARFRAHKITGIQRVAHEIVSRLGTDLEICQPGKDLTGWKARVWEQTVLPLRSQSGLLWSPYPSGPLFLRRHVVTFHDLFAVDSPEWYSKAFAQWYGLTMRRLAAGAVHLIAVSEYTKTRLVKRFDIDASKITVVYNGVDLERFYPTPEKSSEARSALNLPSSEYLLCLGSLEPRKNLTRLLAAWASVLPELPQDLWLVVAGSGDQGVYTNANLGKIPDRVMMTGYVSEEHLRGLYAGSLGFVYPSIAEGFGLPPVEAMACGVPVLTSSVTSLPEVCGDAAVYVDPLDEASIAGGIKRFVQDIHLRQRLALAGRERAKRFTWRSAADGTLSVLRAATSLNVT